MRRLKELANKYFFNDNLPFESLILNFVCFVGVLAATAAIISRLVAGLPFVTVVPILFFLVSVAGLFVVSIKRAKHAELLMVITLCILSVVFWPSFFFTIGGPGSGMAAYFVCIIILIFTFLKGKTRVIMFMLTSAAIVICYAGTLFWGWEVLPEGGLNTRQMFIDAIQSIFIVGILMGAIVLFQARLYQNEKNKAEAAVARLEAAQRSMTAITEEAQAANQAKSAFLANMSHEIRTPMNSIMGFAELAMYQAISPQVKEYMSKITESTRWLLRIINDILDISKIESGKLELEKIPFDLHGIFMRCQSVILPDANEKNLDLQISIDTPGDKRLIGDPIRLYQALMNLLSNAVKFTSEGTVKMSSIVLSSDEYNSIIRFEVKDSGIGMGPDQIKKIFEPFVQADSSTTRNYGGTGLGLSITKSIVELMGGELKVESVPGAGSSFSFDLTFETVLIPEDILEYAKSGTIKKPHFDGVVLVCEDNAMNQQLIREHLAGVGLEAIIAENGKAGVEKVQERMLSGKKPFDLIFMDIFMPVMDGVETASRIIALGSGAPIVAMTANVMESELKVYEKNGISGCLNKPFTSAELWRCLLKYIMPVSISNVEGAVFEQEDVRLQEKLRVKFVKDNKSKYEELALAIGTDDLTLAHRLAHSLKTNAGMIGKTRLRNAAAEIEALLFENKKPLAASMESLEAELKKILFELTPLLDEQDNRPERAPLSAGEIEILFAKLEPMLRSRNTECLSLLDEIRAVPGAGELALHIEKYNFRQAAQALAALKKEGT